MIHWQVSGCVRKHISCPHVSLPGPLLTVTTKTAEELWCLLGIIIQRWKLVKVCQELTTCHPFSHTQCELVCSSCMPWGRGAKSSCSCLCYFYSSLFECLLREWMSAGIINQLEPFKSFGPLQSRINGPISVMTRQGFHWGPWSCIRCCPQTECGFQCLYLHLISLRDVTNHVPPAIPGKHRQCSHSGPIISLKCHFPGPFTCFILSPLTLLHPRTAWPEMQIIAVTREADVQQPWQSCPPFQPLPLVNDCPRDPTVGKYHIVYATFLHLVWLHLAATQHKVHIISYTIKRVPGV